MTPIKDELTLLTAKLRANARVDLYDKNYLYRIKWTFPLLLLITSISLTILFSFDLLTQSQLIICSFLCFAILIAVQWIARRARVAVLKGDTIILKGIDSKSTITPVKSIKKASSFTILGTQITRLNYTLDHQKKSSLIFGAPSGMQTSLDKLLQHAKNCKKK